MKRAFSAGGWVAMAGLAAAVALGPVRALAAEKSAGGKAVTYSNQVARILQKNCQTCHRPGEAAPFSLLTYEQAKKWGETVAETVGERRMPPWLADPKHGKFANNRSLSQEEIDTLAAWVDAGMPKGDDRDLPEPVKFVDGWQIGKPDVVLTMPQEYQVQARGTIEYQYFSMPTNFAEDKWVQAAEIRPGNRKVVHHVLMMVMPPGSRDAEGRPRLRDNEDNPLGFFAAMAPGAMPTVFPAGFGKRIPKGSDVVFQMHYTAVGAEEKDRTSVGLVFAKEPVHTEVHTRGVFNNSFVIPPGAANYAVKAAYKFSRDTYVTALLPHTHVRGKSFDYIASYPNGKVEKVLSIPRYNFNWQLTYELEKPLLMPKGSRLSCIAHYDNSAKNEANPNPKARVTWGDQTWDEMLIGYFHYYERSESVAARPAATGE